MDAGRAVPAAARGGSFNIPGGVKNYYDSSNQTASQIRNTMMSHAGTSFTTTDPGGDFKHIFEGLTPLVPAFRQLMTA